MFKFSCGAAAELFQPPVGANRAGGPNACWAGVSHLSAFLAPPAGAPNNPLLYPAPPLKPPTSCVCFLFGPLLMFSSFFFFQSRKHANRVRLYQMLHPADGGCPAKKLRTDTVSPPVFLHGPLSCRMLCSGQKN